MQPAVLQAIDAWEQHWHQTQAAAVAALKAAFPRLGDRPRYVGCNDIRLEYEEAGLGGGRVCLDDEGRANVEFDRVPNEVIARAVDGIRLPYLDYADGPLCEAPPGTYVYECEGSAAQFEFTLGKIGHGQVVISFATIPDAVAILDALERALDEHDADATRH
ncbi:hypothetical protein GCM10010218_12750 [Streptomyces mashuensis]|uniref:Uncharacterized protein n=1 Tax=Streptomyces mashuensis TaxID=33904 RepID=A0A919AYT9_9ACTN|nr:hypothetical protein [Streptomyces mashuensis]GHF33119.1 hypothetical protein GCM10010218_12750 [Streptomyces mashuensis]